MNIEEYIINKVSSLRGVNKDQMLSKSRKRELVQSRQECMYLLKKTNRYTFAEIGSLFNKDHTTAIHAIRTISNLLETNKIFKQEHEIISDKFERYCKKHFKKKL